jgi:hypothetical protein
MFVSNISSLWVTIWKSFSTFIYCRKDGPFIHLVAIVHSSGVGFVSCDCGYTFSYGYYLFYN